MVFGSSNLIETRRIVSEELERPVDRSVLFKERKQNWASKLHLITCYKGAAGVSAPHKVVRAISERTGDSSVTPR